MSHYRKLDRWQKLERLRVFYKRNEGRLYVDNDLHVPFTILEWKEEEAVQAVPFWWRFTLFVWPVYIALALIFLLLKWVVTGKTGMPRKWLDNVHYPWKKKINL